MPEGTLNFRNNRPGGLTSFTSPHVVGRRASIDEGALGAELTVSMIAAECMRRLESENIFVAQSSDLDHAMTVIEQLDKPYLTDYLSPLKNDFFRTNCFWFIFNDQHGQPGGLIGCRMDDSGQEPLSSYACRKLRNMFPEEDEIPVQPDRLPRIADEIKGRVVYAGDLYLSRSFRTTNRRVLRMIVVLVYCVMFLKWKDLDWIYAFMRDRDVARGAAWLYQFPRNYPMAHSWTKPPSDQTGENWLAAMSRLELMDMLSAYFAAPDRL